MVRRIVALFVMVLLSAAAHAEGFQYEEGTHFAKLEVPVKTRDPEVVEVTEYFSYGCPHCYRLEPLVARWKEDLSPDIEFNRTPAIWKVSGYELYARTYYTAKALGVLEQIHGPLFNAIHGERRRLLDLESMAGFMAAHGVDSEKFTKTFNDSFGVKAMYQQAIARQRVYRASGVPAIVVNGKNRIEAAMVDNSNANMLKVATFLIDREKRLLSDEGEDDE
ncbi:MAG: thiol:disulfide interchange protein DsbA/DsbL [Gammaproteobacteria bacterium]|nr:thiol:disulfide interchange protein DsbA/DsbL [Gammaproteobacteria bacterium]